MPKAFLPGNRLIVASTLIFVLAAVLLLAYSFLPYDTVRAYFDRIAADGSADAFTIERYVQASRGALALGLLFLLKSILFFVFRHRLSALAYTRYLALRQSCVSETRSFRTACLQEPKLYLLALLSLTVAGITIRQHFLDQPIRYDESYTFLTYGIKPFFLLLSNYNEPNNHLLHSVFVHTSYLLFGNEEWVVRLPGFVAGVVLLPLLYFFVRMWTAAEGALFALAFAAGNSLLVEYSTIGRGYTMLLCFFLLTGICAKRLCRKPIAEEKSDCIWLCFTVSGALGLYTVPVMLYPLGGICLWFLLQIIGGKDTQHLRVRDFIIALVATACITTILYLPALFISGISAIAGNIHVAPKSIAFVLEHLPTSLAETLLLWLRDIPSLLRGLLLFSVLAALIPPKNFRSSLTMLICCTLVWCLVFVFAQRVVPFTRVWMFALLLVLALAGVGFSRILAAITRSKLLFRMLLGIVCSCSICYVLMYTLRTTNAVFWSKETGVLRDAHPFIQAIEPILRPGDLIVASPPADYPLKYYAWRDGLSLEYFDRQMWKSKRVFVVDSLLDELTVDDIVRSLDVGNTANVSRTLFKRTPEATLILLEFRSEDGVKH